MRSVARALEAAIGPRCLLRGGGKSTRGVHRLREEAFGPSRLDLQEIDRGLFLAAKECLLVPLGGRGVFGGQVVGQALHAAARTLPEDSEAQVHSLHAYFLKPGLPEWPILYQVQETSTGRSFSTRSVEARQNGVIIFKCQTSFQNPEESSVEHAVPMPEAPEPESLPSVQEVAKELMQDPRIQDEDEQSKLILGMLQSFEKMRFPIEVKYASYQPDYLAMNPEGREPRRLMWLRTRLPLGDDPNVHRVAAAFFSDYALLATALLPYGIQFPGVSMLKLKILASLDHSMWFHTAFRADEWMLYEMESTRAGGGRALTLGKLYKRDGTLAVSVAQEGVLRLRRPEKDAADGIIMPPM